MGARALALAGGWGLPAVTPYAEVRSDRREVVVLREAGAEARRERAARVRELGALRVVRRLVERAPAALRLRLAGLERGDACRVRAACAARLRFAVVQRLIGGGAAARGRIAVDERDAAGRVEAHEVGLRE